MARFVFFSVTILFVTCCLPGCMDTPEEEIKINEGMKVDELYYFSSFFAFDLEIRNGNNVTLENQRLVRCDEKPYVGCIDEEFDGNLMNFEVPLNYTEELGVWIDTSTYSSPIFGMYETTEKDSGSIFTDRGIGFIFFNTNAFIVCTAL